MFLWMKIIWTAASLVLILRPTLLQLQTLVVSPIPVAFQMVHVGSVPPPQKLVVGFHSDV